MSMLSPLHRGSMANCAAGEKKDIVNALLFALQKVLECKDNGRSKHSSRSASENHSLWEINLIWNPAMISAKTVHGPPKFFVEILVVRW